MINGERIFNTEYAYNENPFASKPKSRRETIRRRLRKKRFKFREKLKERKAFRRKEGAPEKGSARRKISQYVQ
jgi:hypothetical protein